MTQKVSDRLREICAKFPDLIRDTEMVPRAEIAKRLLGIQYQIMTIATEIEKKQEDHQ